MDFWRRWHISLGIWFRDYVYIPLGGNRCGPTRNMLNLFAVWFLTGLWHGANYTFLIWGLLHFVLLALERRTGLNQPKGGFSGAVQWVYTMIFVLIGWVIFRADSVRDALRFLGNMFGFYGNPFSDGAFRGWAAQNAILQSLHLLQFLIRTDFGGWICGVTVIGGSI